MHGNKSQPQRERALAEFRDGGARVLVATDIAARGIDVEGVSHVINFELPNVPEDYVHRIGRTARAGAAGIAIAFCSDEERGCLRDIEKLTRRSVPVIPTPGAADGGQPGRRIEEPRRGQPVRRTPPRSAARVGYGDGSLPAFLAKVSGPERISGSQSRRRSAARQVRARAGER